MLIKIITFSLFFYFSFPNEWGLLVDNEWFVHRKTKQGNKKLYLFGFSTSTVETTHTIVLRAAIDSKVREFNYTYVVFENSTEFFD